MTLRPLRAFTLILLTFLSISAQSQQTPPIAGKSTFNELAEKAKKGDRSIDFTELRIAFYESANYHPHTPMMTYRELYGALAQKNYAAAIKTAESVLEKNFVEVNAHMVAQIAYQESGNAERAQFHKFMADGLLNSIKSKGDGKSTGTAFEVISINEEYGLLRSMSLRPIKQSLLQDKGHHFDALTVVDPQTNQQSVFYFNVDKPFNWEDKKKQD
jgi:hypothetical protein